MFGIFQGTGNPALWLIFAAIVGGAYVISLLIDVIVMKRKATCYTAMLEAYVKRM
ncbi:MAG: hypothetical protein K5678_06895 [Acetatifactor sp.]|nr:hypothetical protein [Acetatifactor sp.]